MESKLINVRTDGDILRSANVIAGLEIDGSEYVVYYIDRDDGENDNLFVSKLIKNTDGTYNMLNIENANEKINISNLVKQIVKYAIDDSANDTLVGETVTLGAKVIKVCPVLINKEQAIDIQKTYITTVKKTVTNVTKKYYDVKFASVPEVKEELFPSNTDAVFAEPTPVQVAATSAQENIVSSVTQPQTVSETVPTPVEPVLPVLDAAPEPAAPAVVEVVPPVAPVPVTPTVSEPVQVAPVVETPVAPIIEPSVPVVNTVEKPVLDIPAGIITEPVQTATPVAPAPVVPEPVQSVVAPVLPAVEPTPIQPVSVAAPVVPEPVVQTPPVVAQPAVATPVTPEPAKLVLDASKESNLKASLGEISKESIPVSDINSIKEFGVDEPVSSAPTTTIAPMVQPEASTQPNVLTKKAGFANSKFFMFVAVGFFVASCIFLGYEAFNYYQIVK